MGEASTKIKNTIYQIKVDVRKVMKTSRFGHKEWLEICAMLFGDGVEDKIKYASCFVTLFPLNS